MISQYYTPDVQKECGVKRNRLQVWLEKGWITPSIQKANGQGNRNIFSGPDLARISIFKRLLENGISRTAAGKVIAGVTDSELGEYANGGRVLCILLLM
jgi:DNA-binding transcriptional MerR regulator